jgi:hypothetical protein
MTVPIVIYSVLRYYQFIDSGSEIARNPEKIIKDWRMIIAAIIYILMILWIFYYADHQQLTEWIL